MSRGQLLKFAGKVSAWVPLHPWVSLSKPEPKILHFPKWHSLVRVLLVLCQNSECLVSAGLSLCSYCYSQVCQHLNAPSSSQVFLSVLCKTLVCALPGKHSAHAGVYWPFGFWKGMKQNMFQWLKYCNSCVIVLMSCHQHGVRMICRSTGF